MLILVAVINTDCWYLETGQENPEPYSYISDVCDWKGSKSLNDDSERSVTPIYLRCSRGNIKWFYPTGGLLVVLKLGTNNKDFHGCIRVARNTTRNVRIYIEGKRQLFQIFAADDGKHPDLFRCFVSVNHFMSLFIETDTNSLYPHDSVIFSYDLQEINSNLSSPLLLEDNGEDNYHSCTDNDNQILKLFCSADFSLTGRISYYHTLPELDLTEFTVKPLYIYRLLFNGTFVNDLNLISNNQFVNKFDSNQNIDINLISKLTLNLPAKYKLNINSNRYLFLGKQILDKYIISCLMPLDQWKQIYLRAINTGTNQCQINGNIFT